MPSTVTVVVNEQHNDANEVRFTICDRRTLIIQTQNVSMRREIPAGGLQASHIINISFLLGGIRRFSGPWLAAQLSRPQFEGAAGSYVADLATLYGADLNRIADLSIREHRPTPIHPLQLHPVADPEPEDFCVVCQNTEEGGWVIIQGCNRHRFHRLCVADRFHGTTCMLCRAPLRR
jgi:hypothetical protein